MKWMFFHKPMSVLLTRHQDIHVLRKCGHGFILLSVKSLLVFVDSQG